MAQSTQQLALLKNNLQIPLIVRDLLVTRRAPSPETTYSLHEMMGSFHPDRALLCAAFVMKEIASLESMATGDLGFLHLECERLIERYSARDDLAQDNPDLWEETQIDMMGEIAEDLEGFIDLLSLCKLSFEITAPYIAHTLEILDVQLQCQLMIIDTVVESLAMMDTTQLPKALPASTVTGHDADNVLAFPNLF